MDQFNRHMNSTNPVMDLVDQLDLNLLQRFSAVVASQNPHRSSFIESAAPRCNLNTLRLLILMLKLNLTFEPVINSPTFLEDVLGLYKLLCTECSSVNRAMFRLLHVKGDYLIPQADVTIWAAQSKSLHHLFYFAHLGYTGWPEHTPIHLPSPLVSVLQCCRVDESMSIVDEDLVYVQNLIVHGMPICQYDLVSCFQPKVTQMLLDTDKITLPYDYLTHCARLSHPYSPERHKLFLAMINVGVQAGHKWPAEFIEHVYSTKHFFQDFGEGHELEQAYLTFLRIGCQAYLPVDLMEAASTVRVLLKYYSLRHLYTGNGNLWETYGESIISFLNDFCLVFPKTVQFYQAQFEEFVSSSDYRPDPSRLRHQALNQDTVQNVEQHHEGAHYSIEMFADFDVADVLV
jgi:hypothetical protein